MQLADETGAMTPISSARFRHVALLTLAVTLLGVSCSDDDGDEDRAALPELVATCGSVEFPTVPAEPDELPLLDASVGEIDWSVIDASQVFREPIEWRVASHTSDALALYGRTTSGEQTYANFEREGERWVPGGGGFGGCRIEVSSPGWGTARFLLTAEPAAGAEQLVLTAWENECASGEAPTGRAVESHVIEDERSVSVLVLVEPVSGYADCPSNPSFEHVVELGEPLGDRVVLDASVQPRLERPWPPTDTSLQEQGRVE